MVRARSFRVGMAALLLAAAWAAGSARGEGESAAPPKEAKDAPAKSEPVTYATAAEAAKVLDGLRRQIDQAAALRLEFDAAREAWAKLEPVKPFADKLDADHAKLLAKGLAGVGLAAGEPKDSLAGCRQLLKDEQPGQWARIGYTSAYILGDKDAARTMFGQLSPVPQGAAADADLIGKKVPGGKLDLLGGGKLDTAAGDKVVLFDFWATWCGPCVRMMPRVKAEFEEYSKFPEFAMLGVSMDRPGDKDKVIQFVKAQEMRWLHYYEGKVWSGPLSQGVFGIRSIPHLAVMGPDRQVFYKAYPGDPMIKFAIYAGVQQVRAAKAAKVAKEADKTRPTGQHKTPPPATQPDRPTAAPPPALPAEAKAQGLYNLAQSYRAAGMKQKADELIDQLISDYPASKAAAKAQAERKR